MVKKRADKCKSTGKERDDHGVLTKTRFGPLSIEIKDPRSAILLLKSEEDQTVIAAIAALSTFGSKGTENLGILHDLNVVTLVIPLIIHEEIFVRRFATKLLAEMAALNDVRNFLLSSQCYVSHFKNVLVNDTDIFIHEFVSLILAELSKDMFGVAQLLENCGDNFDFLFERIQSPDPDVKKNSIEILHNLLRDPIAAQRIIKTEDFNFSSIQELLKQPYPVIQLLSLEVINFLVARCKDENIQELFRLSRGPEALLNILDNVEFEDLHQKVLGILSLACDNQKTVDLLCSTDGIHKLLNYMESCDKKLALDILNVIVRLANSSHGRKELHKRGIIPQLLNLMCEPLNFEVARSSYYGIAKMVQYGPAAEEITSSNPIPSIIGSVKNENLKPFVRHAAIYCLAELLSADHRNCFNLFHIEGQIHLLRMIKKPTENISVEMQVTALQCLRAIGSYPDFREQIINAEFIEVLCTLFEPHTNSSLAECKVICCDVLSIYCVEKEARDIFLLIDGPRKLYNSLLDSEPVPVRDAAARLTMQLCFDQVVAAQLILSGSLEYMLKHRLASSVAPSWEACIKALFRSYLPAKFALTGRLSLNDITKNGFYVIQKNIYPFPILDQLFTMKMNPAQTIYICNLSQSRPLTNENQEIKENYSKSEGELERNATVPKIAAKNNIFSVYGPDVTNAIRSEQHEKLDFDPFLCELVKRFKCMVIAKEPKDAYDQQQLGLVNFQYVKSRAKMLGEFVAHQLSGPDPTTKCIDHQLELHLNEVKNDLGTNIISLGQLRVGSYLERALLFKVIADTICLPAALVRGGYGKTWIEIALPEIETQNGQESLNSFANRDADTGKRYRSSSRFFDRRVSTGSGHQSFENPIKESVSIAKQTSSIYPTKLLRPNYIVDLMYEPGKLIPLETKDADEYCSYRSYF